MLPSPALVLSEADNVAVLTRAVAAGERLDVGGREVTLAADLGLGHKVARRDIGAGDKVLKYGAPIGSATRPIAAGEHVHVHNMQSDYLPTYTHEDGRRYAG